MRIQQECSTRAQTALLVLLPGCYLLGHAGREKRTAAQRGNVRVWESGAMTLCWRTESSGDSRLED